MTLAIRDHSQNGAVLVSFDAIANCLEPEARAYSWRIPFVTGMLAPHDDPYTLDDAYADADASLISPISWKELRAWAARFLQFYDCEFQSAGVAGSDDLRICCIDSTQWEITTGIESIIERLRQTFKITTEVRSP